MPDILPIVRELLIVSAWVYKLATLWDPENMERTLEEKMGHDEKI